MAEASAAAERGAASERHAPPTEGKLRVVPVTYEKKVLEVECDEVTLPGKLDPAGGGGRAPRLPTGRPRPRRAGRAVDHQPRRDRRPEGDDSVPSR